MTIRCDEAMRRSKEQARSWTASGIPKWKCKGNCETCICGMRQNLKFEWEHNAKNEQE